MQVVVLLSQTNWQGVPVLCQAPEELQVCNCRPEHCLLLGVQAPVHEPVALSQTLLHAAPLSCHVPVASHICG